MNRELLVMIGKAVASLFLIANYGLILSGVIYKIIARVHGRFGPPVWQPYINLAKLLSMRTAVSHGIMFYLGPIFRITGGVGLYLLIPAVYGSSWLGNFSFSGDIILVLYFIFFGMLGMALGAAESGHPYSAIGVMRGLAQNTASELPFVLAVLALVAQYKTLSITGIVAAQQGGMENWTVFTNPLATIAAMLAFIGMMHRSPFDVHLAPQEIPVGPPTEFHSSFLFMMSFNRAFFGSAKLVLFMNLFFGGATTIPEMIIKTFLIMLWTVFVGAVFPRYRLEQSVRWLLKVPALIGLLALALQMF
ncbi:MAG: NADH-quinone oxidoreductase subunit H [Deltaproteobacteria bacterium]|nr:MAG: NADH-quinone oxidoreductase subunit H [Deltaproteobacteria bacterium]